MVYAFSKRDSAFGLESWISSPRFVDRHSSLISLRGLKNHNSSSKILESQDGFTEQAENKKVDSRENAENVEKSHSKQTKGVFDKRRRRQDLPMILRVFKAWARGFTLSGNEQAHAAESRKSAAKPTPTKQKVDSR